MKDVIKTKLDELLALQVDKADNKIVVVSDAEDSLKKSKETFKNKQALKDASFAWDRDLSAWTMDANKFSIAKKTVETINKTELFIDKLEDLAEFVKNTPEGDGGSSAKVNLSDRISMYANDLANAVDESTMSAEIRRYLTFFANFKNHSFTNTLLIWIQKPDAKRVAGFRQWETKHFRRVKKGAKGIQIFAPMIYKGNEDINDTGLDNDVKTHSYVKFKPVFVFDISDTEPIDKRGEEPQEPEWFSTTEPTERTAELYTYVEEVCVNLGVAITTDQAKGGEKGYAKGDHINMSSSIKGAGELSTFIHELAHTLMHFKDSSIYYQGPEIRRDTQIVELQAESVAYIVMKHYDLPVQHQPTYIALWKGNKEKITANLKAISDVGKFIIQQIDMVAHATKVVSKSN